MKKLIVALTISAAVLTQSAPSVRAEDASLISKFLTTAQSAKDSQLGAIGGELLDKVKTFGQTGLGSAAQAKLNDTLKQLTGGKDIAALGSAFDLVKDAKLTPDQLNVAKQVGNLASAYVVQKNFASLDGSQSDVAQIVSSLREGKLTTMVSPVKNVMNNSHLTDGQKKLIKTVADKYAPGLEKAKDAVNAIKKLPGFGN